MKTAAITAYGGPEVLTVHDAPAPEPGPGEALVAVVASTINPVDVKTRIPGTPQRVGRFPAVLGWDIAGIVVTAPAGSGWAPGDRVITMHPPAPDGSGSWQQYAAIPAERLAPAPESVDLPTAATLPLAGLTADQALRRLDLHAGERLLVTGAAGGVGGMAVQLAAAAGIEVTALVSRPEHESAVLDLGAASAHSSPATAGEFDTIFDAAGVFDYPRLLREGGRLVTVSDDTIPAAVEQRASMAVHNYVQHDRQRLRALSALVDAGKITLRVADLYPLADIEQAHRRAEAGGLLGKVVITM
ncbi:NADP-dependent oxidoreductase [Brachybacterium sp. YJGR34]|uniref:NADP-dependent oxidoreductase n=1 Tax=Brachybacterium sp. YJGR34 TaxID=2059911 RepID=UPI000E0C2014|nr:NADP-dependent oxidoreductase [Brachybacterium sp. YJGR34]